VQTQPLETDKIRLLREAGVIGNDEVPFLVADVLYAENVLTKTRRVINNAPSSIMESKRILHG
jgi:hypothetical protein